MVERRIEVNSSTRSKFCSGMPRCIGLWVIVIGGRRADVADVVFVAVIVIVAVTVVPVRRVHLFRLVGMS